jgi:hypothetical protein
VNEQSVYDLNEKYSSELLWFGWWCVWADRGERVRAFINSYPSLIQGLLCLYNLKKPDQKRF